MGRPLVAPRPAPLAATLVAAFAAALSWVGAASAEDCPAAAAVGADDQTSTGRPSPAAVDGAASSTSDDLSALLQIFLSVREHPAKLAEKHRRQQSPQQQPQRPLQAPEVVASSPQKVSLAASAFGDNTTSGSARTSDEVSAVAGQSAEAARSLSSGAAFSWSPGRGVHKVTTTAPASSSDTAGKGSRIAGMLILVFLILFISVMLFIFDMLYTAFWKVQERSPDQRRARFSTYLEYRIQHWISVGEVRSKAQLMLVVCIVFVFVGTGMYCGLVGENPGTSMFTVYKMILDPSVGYTESTGWGRFIGILMSIGFFFVLALLVAVVQDSVNGYLDEVRLGFSPVIESGHIILLGFTEDTLQLIQELCNGYAPEGGTTIVLLAEEPKQDVEEVIRQARLDLFNSTLVVRSGNFANAENLRQVSVASCATVILAPKRSTPREVRDAATMQMLVVLAGKGWPHMGRILAVCSLARNRPLFETVGGPNTDIINVDDFMGKLMVQCSIQPGIGKVLTSVFSFEGDEFYIAQVPKSLCGKTVGEAQFYYPKCILAGVRRPDPSVRSICPPMDTVLSEGDEVVLFAEDVTRTGNTLQPADVPKPPGADSSPTRRTMQRGPSPQVETIFMFGWNNMIAGVLLYELDEVVAKGSKVIVLAPNTLDERAAFMDRLEKRLGRKLVNLTDIHHVVGRLGSRYQIESLPMPVTKAARIFCLSDYNTKSATEADAATTTMVLMVRDILAGDPESSGRTIPVVPEIRCRATTLLFKELKVEDLVDSSGTPAQIMATIAHAPKLAPVLFDLISDTGLVNVFIRRLSDYLPRDAQMPTTLCFWEAMHYVTAQGDILLGWSADPEDLDDHSCSFLERMTALTQNTVSYEWDMNPVDKMDQRKWNDSCDRVVVVAPNLNVVGHELSKF